MKCRDCSLLGIYLAHGRWKKRINNYSVCNFERNEQKNQRRCKCVHSEKKTGRNDFCARDGKKLFSQFSKHSRSAKWWENVWNEKITSCEGHSVIPILSMDRKILWLMGAKDEEVKRAGFLCRIRQWKRQSPIPKDSLTVNCIAKVFPRARATTNSHEWNELKRCWICSNLTCHSSEKACGIK